MVNYIRILLFIITMQLLLSCGGSTSKKLSTKDFHFNGKNVKDNLERLLEVSDLADYNNEFDILTANSFVITNKYILPFVYDYFAGAKKDFSVITKSDVEEAFEYFTKSRAMLIATYMEAKKAGFKAKTDEINKELNNKSLGDLDTYIKYLDQKSCFNLDFIKQDIIKVIVIKKYQENLFKEKVSVSEHEIKEFYDSHPLISRKNPKASVQHILISTRNMNDKEKEAAHKKALDIWQRAKNGENFEKLVRLYSDDDATKNSDGKIGNYITRGSTLKSFEDVVFSTKPGTIGKIAKTHWGEHIIKVNKIIDEGKYPLDDLLKDKIKTVLERDKEAKVINEEKKRIKKLYNMHYQIRKKN